MTLHRLLADYRKTLRRLRRRASLSSARQVQAWKRRLAHLASRLGQQGRLRTRRAVMTAAMLGLSAGLVAVPTGNSNFSVQRDGKASFPMENSSDDYAAAAFGDIDGDGDLDAVVVTEYSSSYGVRFFKNTGSRRHPHFEQVTGAENPFNGIYSDAYVQMALVDLDGDGDLDFVSGDGMRFFENTGTRDAAVFTQRYYAENPFYTSPYASYTERPTFGDVDGDGDLDMVATFYGDLFLFRNVGSTKAAQFELQHPYFGGSNPFENLSLSGDFYPQLADVDGDGDLDVLVSDYYYSDVFFVAKNTGTAKKPVWDQYETINVDFSNPILSAADIDGDGDVDVYLGNDQEFLVLFENVGSRREFRFSQALLINNQDENDIWVDFDRDGDLDFMGRDFTLKNNRGQLTAVGYYDQPTYNMGGSGRAFGDLDGDGDLDAVAWSGDPRFFQNDGAWTVMGEVTGASSPFYSTAYTYLYGNRYAQLADVDGDGDLDALFTADQDSYSSATHAFLRNDGTATAPSFTKVTGAADPFDNFHNDYQKPFILDIDGDGDKDMISFDTYYGTDHRAYRNNGDGNPWTSLSPAENPLTGLVLDVSGGYYSYSPGTNLITAIDIDGDGDLDFRVFSDELNSWYNVINNLPRYTQVDPVSAAAGKTILGPVPAKQGEMLCLYVDKVTDELDIEFYNVVGEKVSSGLATPGNPCVKADMVPGLYWAKIKSAGRTIVQKIVITKP